MASIAQAQILAIPYLGDDRPHQNPQSMQDSEQDQDQQPFRPQHNAPHTSRPWAGNHCHYQAQLIGAELASSHGRHKARTSPREAARAYGQARRRPDQISNRPRLKTIM